MTATTPDARLSWTPTHPTDVALTLSRLGYGRFDPVQRTIGDVVWRTTRTPDGPATLAIGGSGGDLRVAAWGAGASRAVAAAPALLGQADDPTGFDPRHPLLVDAHRRFPGLRLTRTGQVLPALVGAVLNQRVEGVDANAVWGRLVGRLGEPAPGPAPEGMRVFPPASAWAAIPEWEWRRAGVDSRRARTVAEAARRHTWLESLVGEETATVDAALQTLPGVGAWTSAEVRQRVLGDADAVSVGDFHLAGIVGATLADGPFSDAEMLDFLEPWRPHRHRVARLLYALGIESLPRRAPRRTRPGV